MPADGRCIFELFLLNNRKEMIQHGSNGNTPDLIREKSTLNVAGTLTVYFY